MVHASRLVVRRRRLLEKFWTSEIVRKPPAVTVSEATWDFFEATILSLRSIHRHPFNLPIPKDSQITRYPLPAGGPWPELRRASSRTVCTCQLLIRIFGCENQKTPRIWATSFWLPWLKKQCIYIHLIALTMAGALKIQEYISSVTKHPMWQCDRLFKDFLRQSKITDSKSTSHQSR